MAPTALTRRELLQLGGTALAATVLLPGDLGGAEVAWQEDGRREGGPAELQELTTCQRGRRHGWRTYAAPAAWSMRGAPGPPRTARHYATVSAGPELPTG